MKVVDVYKAKEKIEKELRKLLGKSLHETHRIKFDYDHFENEVNALLFTYFMDSRTCYLDANDQEIKLRHAFEKEEYSIGVEECETTQDGYTIYQLVIEPET